MSYLINENKEKIVTLTVKNNNITKKISIKPVSDKNGNYIILAHEDERLLFSKVGYVTQKQDIQSRKQISIQIVKGE